MVVMVMVMIEVRSGDDGDGVGRGRVTCHVVSLYPGSMAVAMVDGGGGG